MAPRTRPRTSTYTTPTFTVAIYTRLSADPNEEGTAVARQEKASRLLAKAKGWSNLVIYCDNNRSASKDGVVRDEFERLITDIEAGRVQAVICWHLDRLVRRMSDLVRIIEAGQERGLNIATVHGVSLDLGDPTGVAVAQILTAIAQMEVKHKGQRQRASNAQRAEAGRQSTSRCFGYNSDGSVREAEAVLVKRVFDDFAAGAPITELTKTLNESGLRSAGGRSKTSKEGWHRTGVRILLQNRRYIAEVWYRGEYLREGTWTPLVDPDTFAAVQARLNDPTRKTTTGPNRRWLGPGTYRCGACAELGRDQVLASASSVWRRVSGEKVSTPYLLCAEHRTKPAQHLYVKMSPVDEYVKDRIVQRLRDRKHRRSWAADRNSSEARKLSAQRAGLAAKIDAWALDQVSEDPEFLPRQVKLMTADANKRIAEIEQVLADLGGRSKLARLAAAADPGAAWLELDVFGAAEVVEGMCTVVVHNHAASDFIPARDVTITWRRPNG